MGRFSKFDALKTLNFLVGSKHPFLGEKAMTPNGVVSSPRQTTPSMTKVKAAIVMDGLVGLHEKNCMPAVKVCYCGFEPIF